MVELDILGLAGEPRAALHPRARFPGYPARRPIRPRRFGGGGGICDPRLMWDGRADDGHPLPAGVYLAKLKAPGLLVFKRIVFRGK